MNEMEEKKMQALIDRENLYGAVLQEYENCFDEMVEMYFDIESYKHLKKKLRILKAINAGKKVKWEDLVSILEKYPKDEGGG